jgi:hypothetical protein
VLEEFIRVNMLHGYFGHCIELYNICICSMRGERLREKQPPSILHANLLTHLK